MTQAIASRKRRFPAVRSSLAHAAAGSGTAAQGSGGGRVQPVTARVAAGCRPAIRPAEVTPIWMAALLATPCHAVSGAGSRRAFRWECVAGHALYTNRSIETVWIEPFGARVAAGKTLSVTWLPGETAYTLEVFNRSKQYLVA